MKKEISYRFDKDGQIIRIENKLSISSVKEQREKPKEEVHSFKSSKYFLAIFETIDIICFLAMQIKMIVLLVKLYVSLFFLFDFDITTEINIFIPIFAYLCSWWCTAPLKKDKSSNKTDINFQGILFWLIFFAASKVML